VIAHQTQPGGATQPLSRVAMAAVVLEILLSIGALGKAENDNGMF